MNDQEFACRLVTAAFELGAETGWSNVSPAAAAVRAGLGLADARAQFSCTGTILKTFGRMADEAALTGALTEGSTRDRLFDILLRRFDFLQSHRAGVLALMKFLPGRPPLAVYLAELNLVSMGWLLEGAGVSSTGIRGAFARRGLLLVWVYGLRAWSRDDSADLSATMAAVDQALARADSIVAHFSQAPGKAEPL